MTKCPTCNRPMNFAFKTRATSKAEKKLAQDTARAQEAIESLRRFIHGGYLARAASEYRQLGFYKKEGKMLDTDTFNPTTLMVEAAELEIARLEYAISAPALLWRIYRRADKGESYVSAVTEAIEVAA